MKRCIKTILLVAISISLLIALAACGGNAANKAYDKWADESLPKIEDAKAEYEAALATAKAESDIPGVRDALQAYISVLKPVVSELEAIDMGKLTGQYKTDVPPQLEALKNNLGSYESELQLTLDKIEEMTAGMAEGEGAGEEASAEGDEEYGAEGDEEVAEPAELGLEDVWFGVGLDESGNTVTIVTTNDFSKVVLVVTSNEQGIAAQFSGSGMLAEDGTLTITDDATGNEFACILSEATDAYMVLQAIDDGTYTEIEAVDQAEYEATNAQIGEEFELAF